MKESVLTEKEIYQQLLPAFSAELARSGISADCLSLCKNKGHYSVMLFGSQLICRVKILKKLGPTLAFRQLGAEQTHLLDGITQNTTKADADVGMCRIALPGGEVSNQVKDVMTAVLSNSLGGISKQYDCCSRFEECSDAKKCVHPDPAFALGCGYRQILRKGIIYYGKNRNID